MTKKLVRDYTFTPGISGVGSVALVGNYNGNEILLITNITDNVIIYNFAAPGYGGTCISAGETNVSVLKFQFDTSSMSSTDSLQIFVDEEYTSVDFNESLIDPVNKIRVSNPQNLIDTDFEYGLQPSKWETLELVSNVPSFYTTQSDFSVSDIVSVISLADSDLITVITQSAHDLPAGTPIDIRGLDSQSAEGKYLISSTPSATTFTYKAKTKQQYSKTISGPYTVLSPGEFYTSSDLKYVSGTGLLTDNASFSNISMQTDYTHGIQVGTSLYLTNTIAARLAKLTNPTTSIAPDGRPYVDFIDTLTTTKESISSFNETKEKTGVIYKKINASAVDIATNKILWLNSGLAVGDALLYTPPAGDAAIGGLQRFQVYYVKTVDGSGITLCETTNGDYNNNPVIDLTSAGTYNYGRAELLIAYEIRKIKRGFTSREEVVTPPPDPGPVCSMRMRMRGQC